MRVARNAAEGDGAEVILLGCAGMAGYADSISEELGITCVDPSTVTLKVTEALVASRIKHAKRALFTIPTSILR